MKQYTCTTAAPFARERWVSAASCGPNGGNCVQVNFATARLVGVRDGKFPAGPVLVFGEEQWHAFLAATRGGRFDLR